VKLTRGDESRLGERIRIVRPNGAGNEPAELRGFVVAAPGEAVLLGQTDYWVRLDTDAPDHPPRYFLPEMLVTMSAVERLAELDDASPDRNAHPVSRAG